MRLSKKVMIEILQQRMENLEKTYGFKPRTGYSQVEGKGESINRRYGEYNAYDNLIFSIENEMNEFGDSK